MPRLETQDLAFRYEDMDMRFDLAVEHGAFMAIIGPSGAGKSTLLSLIGGFERPLGGRVLVDGFDITTMEPAARPCTTLFQDHNLFAHLDVEKNVGLGLDPGLRLDAAQRAEIAQALADVGLTGFEQRLPGQLSGGERQRVAIARCLVRHRPILLLDEPFAALGPGLRREMLDLVRALRDRVGLTVLMVTHDPEDARYAAERTAFIAGGRVVMVDATERLLRSDMPEVRAYLGS
ncbi:MAG TPA: thiamine ABC transporter ATP-binding protein [Alphaproteobacteria bacterium]|nr:thiamine ABC transporter ATP-binding protein [Alphaproteobacteria bacterium]